MSTSSDDSRPTRRVALKVLGATLGLGAFARALAPLTEWTEGMSVEQFLQKHYRELEPHELTQVLAQDRGPKIIVFKKRSKKTYKKTIGHRQNYTELLVKTISA